MLLIYRLLVTCLAPLALWHLGRVGRACGLAVQRAHPTRRAQFDRTPPSHPIWIHAASVGEVNAVKRLVEHWLAQDQSLMMTAFTPTGLQSIQATFGDRIFSAFLPIDQKRIIEKALDQIQPRLLVIAETELWPELLIQCQRRSIPVVVVNGRLSPKTLNRYQRFDALYRPALKAIQSVTCASPSQARRWHELGITPERVVVAGNLKAQMMDAQPTQGHPLCWVAGSVHPKEDGWMIEVHQQLRAHHPKAQLIIAPRHLIHVPRITEALDQARLSWAPYAPNSLNSNADCAVWVIQTLGQLRSAYAEANICFVGGSLVTVGGHNLFEPAALGKAVICGPHTEHQADMVEALKASQALIEIDSIETLTQALTDLMNHPEKATALGELALNVVRDQAHSLERTLDALSPWLGESQPIPSISPRAD